MNTAENIIRTPSQEVEILSVRGVSKKFSRNIKASILYGLQDIASELCFLNRKCAALRPKEFWALNNVNFELRRGEVLGLIGRNGAGKTTLLKLINGIIKPDTGHISVKGRVAPLIALGAGFSPILSGRENIATFLSLLGLTSSEIRQREITVIDFADLGDVIDSPVQTYSSGMEARLAFSCAVHADADILLVDEVLAVGDLDFRLRCYDKLSELRQRGTSIVFVSHNPIAISSVCTRALYIREGCVVTDSDVASALAHYERDSYHSVSENERISQKIIQGVEFSSNDEIHCGESFEVTISCSFTSKIAPRVFLLIKEQGRGKYPILTFDSGPLTGSQSIDGNSSIKLSIPSCSLAPGIYTIKVTLLDSAHSKTIDIYEGKTLRVVSDTATFKNLFHQPHSWELQRQ